MMVCYSITWAFSLEPVISNLYVRPALVIPREPWFCSFRADSDLELEPLPSFPLDSHSFRWSDFQQAGKQRLSRENQQVVQNDGYPKPTQASTCHMTLVKFFRPL